jgi:hypothetical protein
MSDHGRSDAFKLRAVAGTIKVQDGFPTLTNHMKRVARRQTSGPTDFQDCQLIALTAASDGIKSALSMRKVRHFPVHEVGQRDRGNSIPQPIIGVFDEFTSKVNHAILMPPPVVHIVPGRRDGLNHDTDAGRCEFVIEDPSYSP